MLGRFLTSPLSGPRSSQIWYNRRKQVELISFLLKVVLCALAVLLPFYIYSFRTAQLQGEQNSPLAESLDAMKQLVEAEQHTTSGIKKASLKLRGAHHEASVFLSHLNNFEGTERTGQLQPGPPKSLKPPLIFNDVRSRKFNPVHMETTEIVEKPHKATSDHLFGSKTTLLLLCFDRPEYLEKTFKSILSHLPKPTVDNKREISVTVSQDGDNARVAQVVDTFLAKFAAKGFQAHERLSHPRAPKRKDVGRNDNYYKLSDHYHWAIKNAFKDHEVKRLIILEDDMEIAPDFFEYMGAGASLLDVDPTLMAVSAWNDHGQRQFVKDKKRLFRTDFFPGLGWILTRRLWNELEPNWPEAYWDDWLRAPEQTKQRQFIAPEVSRTFTFGKLGGASDGRSKFYKQFIETMSLNHHFVPFTTMNLDYLQPDAYDVMFNQKLDKAKTLPSVNQVDRHKGREKTFRINYVDSKHYYKLCNELGLNPDVKYGIPRAGFQGTVSIRFHDHLLLLAPEHPGIFLENVTPEKKKKK